MSCAHKGESSMMVTEIGGNIVATSSGPDVANGAEAFQDVRYKSVVMGEDAVINVVCKSGGVDWSHNCWSTIKCLGNAVSQK